MKEDQDGETQPIGVGEIHPNYPCIIVNVNKNISDVLDYIKCGTLFGNLTVFKM